MARVEAPKGQIAIVVRTQEGTGKYLSRHIFARGMSVGKPC